jgi:hypothetical protein
MFCMYDSKEEYYVSHSRCISLLRILTIWLDMAELSCTLLSHFFFIFT